MAEYFDVSLILEKSILSKGRIIKCLRKFGLSEGENKISNFGNKTVIVSCIEDEQADFLEVSIGFSGQVFHENLFKKELKPFTTFIGECFECSSSVVYALCSYELNGYLIGDIKNITDIKNILNKFPIVYMKNVKNIIPDIIINISAQEIFN